MLFLTTSKLLYSAHIIYSLGQVWAKTNKTSNRLRSHGHGQEHRVILEEKDQKDHYE